jgi:hypothetical protein
VETCEKAPFGKRMKTLQITLFVIANVIFISQAGRNVHHLIFATQPSVLDRFNPEMQKARSEKQLNVLLADYQAVSDEISALEKGKKQSEAMDIRQQHAELYQRQRALQSEIMQRETNNREMRDVWIFSGYGLLLIAGGILAYKRGVVWPGFGILVAGFCVLEYWASPTYFGGGAVAEFHQLLLSKTVLTFMALAALYAFWLFRDEPSPASPANRSQSVHPAAERTLETTAPVAHLSH